MSATFRWVFNEEAETPREPDHAILDAAGFAAAEAEITSWPGYAPTPLVTLPALARRLGLGALFYKDEGRRFGLRSFKALGGAYAVRRLLAKSNRTPAEVTVTCATAGNHGRSVAWGAQQSGCRCVIFVHAGVSAARAEAIERFGAEVVRVAGNYDDAVRAVSAEAAKQGWFVVSDTSYPGYHEIPIDVMHGYGVMAAEIARQLPGAEPPSHVLVQVGVGALAAALCDCFRLRWGSRRPRFITVEPAEADCLLRSLEARRRVAVTGRLDTVMGGLAAGEVSELAWDILRTGADAALAIDDGNILEAMRVFAEPQASDPAIEAGESGVAGLAALLALRDRAEPRTRLELDGHARVLLIGSEGATDPESYRRFVGRPARSGE